ncbi:MAG TPA: HesA/MoeB/ThiF family protein [Wenzhouxiangella sp.]|nr:HesA/MoeB/ThiF family protein [Wenzhouxiangella sp.]
MSGRYAKQFILPEIGPEGQDRLAAGRVLCVGAGGLGCAVLPYLTGAGVGHITIIDNDRVDRTNLQRQVLFGESSLDRPKANAAAERLRDLNPDIAIRAIVGRLDLDNVEELLLNHDVIVDGSDNYATKYLIADACVKFGRPLVYGTVTGMEAMVTVFHAEQGPCLRCLFPQAPTGWVPNCAEAGVLGSLVGMTGSLQASEAIKLLVGDSTGLQGLIGRLWVMDARDGQSRLMAVKRRKDCNTCSQPAGEITLQAAPRSILREIDVDEARALSDWTFLDVREPDEFAAGHIPGALNLPLSQLQNGTINPPAESRCVLYCESGVRCRTAAEILKEHDYHDIRGLRGGLPAWQATVNLHTHPDQGASHE